MPRRCRLACTVLLVATAGLAAQSPLTSLFLANNNGANGFTVFFDLTVNTPVVLNQIDVNLFTGSVAGTIDVWTTPTTWVGHETTTALWTLAASGAVTAQPMNTGSPVPLSPVSLAAGSYGIALVHNGVAPAYSSGQGISLVYANSQLTMVCGASAAGGLGTPICCSPRVCNASIHYSVPGGTTAASLTAYGDGCNRASRSFYELFGTAAAFDLGNSGLHLGFTGAAYQVTAGGTFVPPSAAATALSLGDDDETTVALASPLAFPGGSTTSLQVCSNGFVSAGPGNGTSYQPDAAQWLQSTAARWGDWHDYDPTAGGAVRSEQIGSVVYLTWDGVYDFNGTAPNTWQLQFDLATGDVTMVFAAMTLLGGPHLVGFAAAGPSVDLSSLDLSAALPLQTAAADSLPLHFAASARPLIGTNLLLVTSAIPASTFFGVDVFSFVSNNPGVDLTSLGMPGCSQYVNFDVPVTFAVGGANANLLLPVPSISGLLGLHVFAQSAGFCPAANALGVVTSNGLDLGIGDF
jgi:hypothetical protein